MPTEPEPKMSDTVLENLYQAFPRQFQDILYRVRWSHLDGCWLVTLCGMTVGIETDGYIHS
jgi:hypothetical protein